MTDISCDSYTPPRRRSIRRVLDSFARCFEVFADAFGRVARTKETDAGDQRDHGGQCFRDGLHVSILSENDNSMRIHHPTSDPTIPARTPSSTAKRIIQSSNAQASESFDGPAWSRRRDMMHLSIARIGALHMHTRYATAMNGPSPIGRR